MEQSSGVAERGSQDDIDARCFPTPGPFRRFDGLGPVHWPVLVEVLVSIAMQMGMFPRVLWQLRAA